LSRVKGYIRFVKEYVTGRKILLVVQISIDLPKIFLPHPL